MKNLLKAILLSVIVLLSFSRSYAQKEKIDKKAARIAAVQKMIDTADFVFYAQKAYPQHGNATNLSDNYSFTASNGEIDCLLPYFGTVQVASMDFTDQGVKFNTKDFDYFVQQKDFGWNVLFKPNSKTGVAMKDVKEITMSIKTNKTASLQLSFANRERIVFDGIIEKAKGKG